VPDVSDVLDAGLFEASISSQSLSQTPDLTRVVAITHREFTKTLEDEVESTVSYLHARQTPDGVVGLGESEHFLGTLQTQSMTATSVYLP
jgi:hypothetical protein